ncbi:MAG: pyruvate carboxylase subunit B [Chloroflexi bacterium]|nr:pyruvate carboxylase subunit B [Chloroflexota bacterium]
MATAKTRQAAASAKPETPTATPLKITDTTLRDGHQCTIATRLRTEDMLPIVEALDEVGFHSLEVWGGATFDVTTRFLADDPWVRLKEIKKRAKKTPLQMLLRGQNLVGYRNYPDDVVRAFVHHTAECGIDIFRVFDAVNDERNHEAAYKAIKETGKHIQATVCFSLTEPRMGGPVFNLDYYVKKAKLLEDMGADSLCLKDMAGMISPLDAYEAVKELKAKLKIPVQLHTHYTSGMASMAVLKVAEAGIDVVDCALAPLALRAAQPAVEPIIVTLQGSVRDTGLNLKKVLAIGEYLEKVLPKYRDFLNTTRFGSIDTSVLEHQVPGGMISNLVAQLREADAIDRLPEVLEELPRTRKDMGMPPLVTPTSQIVGVQTVNNVLFGRYKMVTAQVKDYAYGLYGHPPVPMDPDFVKLALKGYPRGETPITCRPADVLEPEMEKAKDGTKGLAKDMGDVLIYALYPTTGTRFLRWKYNLEPVPDDAKPKTLDDIKREDELIAKIKKGDAVVTKDGNPQPPQNPPPARSGRGRAFNVYIGNEHFRVEVEPEGGAAPSTGHPAPAAAAPPPSHPAAPPPRPAAPPAAAPAAPAKPEAPKLASGETAIKAPMPGIVIRYMVQEGQAVKTGDVVVILEAMKMENALPSPVDGSVKKLAVAQGTKVAKEQVLAVIG